VKILVIGATGGTGHAIVREAHAHGHEVTALVRSRATAAALLPGTSLEEGDARDPVALSSALEGCDAVISALGPRKVSPFRQVTLLSEATHTLVGAMEEQGVSRLVCITGLGAGDSAGLGGFVYDRLINRCCCARSTKTRTGRKRSPVTPASTGSLSDRRYSRTSPPPAASMPPSNWTESTAARSHGPTSRPLSSRKPAATTGLRKRHSTPKKHQAKHRSS